MRNTFSVVDWLQLVSIVDAVEVLEAFKRIPENLGVSLSLALMTAGCTLNLATRTFARTVWAMTVKSSTEIA